MQVGDLAVPDVCRGGHARWAGGGLVHGWWLRMAVLLTLSQGAEAAGTGGGAVAVGAGAADVMTAAVAAACSVGKGFWANRVAQDWGNVRLGDKTAGSMRLLMNNIRRVKKDGSGGTDMVLYAQAMEAMTDADVDLLGLVDTGVEDGSAPGQALLWSAGKLKAETARHWGVRQCCGNTQKEPRVRRVSQRGTDVRWL